MCRGPLRGQHRSLGEEPAGAGECAADVEAAEVVDLREHPADPQRPVQRGGRGDPEEHVDYVLLADQDRQGEIRQHQVARRMCVQPVVAGEPDSENDEVGRQHEGDQPVVVHQPRVFPQAPHT